VLSYSNDGLTSIKHFPGKDIKTYGRKFRRRQPNKLANLIMARTQGFAEQSFDTFSI